MLFQDFYNNEIIPNTENLTLRQIIADFHDFEGKPQYLKQLIERWPLPPFIQGMKITPTDAISTAFSLEAMKRIFKLCRIILLRMGIEINGEGDVVLCQNAPEGILLIANKDKCDRKVLDHAIQFLADVVTNLFCIGCYRIAVAVGNMTTMLCGTLVEQKVIISTCAGITKFQYQLCSTANNFFLPQQSRYFDEHDIFLKLIDPTPITHVHRGRKIGFCKHGILAIVVSGGQEECLFSRIREFRDNACQ